MNYGLLSLLPPVVAVILAIWSKNVILSLFCGGFVGAMIFCGGNPFVTVHSMIGDYFFIQLTDSYNAGVLVLIVFIGGFIKLVEKSGGAQAFGKSVYRIVNTKLKAQLCAWLGGILIFFSDLGTPLLVGPVFRPLFDKLKISRQKLAWILMPLQQALYFPVVYSEIIARLSQIPLFFLLLVLNVALWST